MIIKKSTKINLLSIIYALVLSGYPIAAILSLNLGLENRAITIPFRLTILIVGIFLVFLSINNKKNYNFAFYSGFILFWAIYFLKIFLGEVFGSTGQINIFEFFIYAFGTCFFPMLAFFSFIPPDSIERVRSVSFIVLFIGCSLSLYYGLNNILGLTSQGIVVQRLSFEFIDPISIGNFGVSLTLLSVYSVAKKNINNNATKFFYIFSVLLGIFSTVASGSRGPIISLLIVLILFIVSSGKVKVIKSAFLSIFLILVTLWFLNFLVEKLELDSMSRIQAGFQYKSDQSILERFELISWAVNSFLANPIVGGSVEGQGRGRYPHNVLVESFMATGVIGGIAFSLMFFSAVVHAVRILKHKKDYAWISLIFLQYAISAQFSGSLYTNSIMWCFMAAVIGNFHNKSSRVIHENSICS